MAGDLRGRRTSQEPEVSTKESSPGFSPFESASSVTSIDGPNPAVLVGYACRVAGADRPSKLWENLVQQKDVRCKMPADRFNVDNFFHPDGTHKGTVSESSRSMPLSLRCVRARYADERTRPTQNMATISIRTWVILIEVSSGSQARRPRQWIPNND